MMMNALPCRLACCLLSIAVLAPMPAAFAADGKIQPGQWRSTDTVLEMTNPLLSPEAVAKRKSKPLVAEYCVRSDDLVALVVGEDPGGACEGPISKSGGRISVTRKCASLKSTRKIEGAYSATKIDTVRDVTMKRKTAPSTRRRTL